MGKFKRSRHTAVVQKSKSIINNLKKGSNTMTHGATLNGTVNPNGLDATVAFEYGVDTNYGSGIALPGIISGTTEQPVSADITDLLPDTVYHFRITAVNSAGTAIPGEDKFFTTPSETTGNVPTVTTLDATNIT